MKNKLIQNAILTIQFHRNNKDERDKTLNCSVFTEKGTLNLDSSWWQDTDNMNMFGRSLANGELGKNLDDKRDRFALYFFCRGFIDSFIHKKEEEANDQM